MRGAPADIVKHSLFVMVPIGPKMLRPHLNSLVKKVRKPIYVLVRKQITRPIAMDLIRIKKAFNRRLF